MFGSKKIQELEARLGELQSRLEAVTGERDQFSRQLESANGRIAELEAQLNDFDLEQLKEEAKSSRAEYEGLRELYARKNKEFDDSVEQEEQAFAREQALKRHNLENEIRDNRQANQDYVASTVKTFGESYNYYLNQIKVLMDALGNVATRTGEALFAGENGDLKARFGSQMRDMLKSGADALGGGDGDLVLIGTSEETEEPVEAAEEFFDEAEEAAEEGLEAAGECLEDAEEDAEAAEEVIEEAEKEILEEAEKEALEEAEEGDVL